SKTSRATPANRLRHDFFMISVCAIVVPPSNKSYLACNYSGNPNLLGTRTCFFIETQAISPEYPDFRDLIRTDNHLAE
ncbi:MAG: hypothetical protein JXR89_11580, partial [Deltaproteobacteria bacterium]|nr:hypothetical protein [Deltaproteobacteria bacterium]